LIAASEPKMKKSYHSKTVPAEEAAITSQMRWRSAVSLFAIPTTLPRNNC